MKDISSFVKTKTNLTNEKPAWVITIFSFWAVFAILDLTKIIYYITFYCLKIQQEPDFHFKVQNVLLIHISSAVLIFMPFFLFSKKNKSIYFNIMFMFLVLAVAFIYFDVNTFTPWDTNSSWYLHQGENQYVVSHDDYLYMTNSLDKSWLIFAATHNLIYHILFIPLLVILILKFRQHLNFNYYTSFFVFCALYYFGIYLISEICVASDYPEDDLQYILFNKPIPLVSNWISPGAEITFGEYNLHNTFCLIFFVMFPAVWYASFGINKFYLYVKNRKAHPVKKSKKA